MWRAASADLPRARRAAAFTLVFRNRRVVHQHARRAFELRARRRPTHRAGLPIRERVALALTRNHESARSLRYVHASTIDLCGPRRYEELRKSCGRRSGPAAPRARTEA